MGIVELLPSEGNKYHLVIVYMVSRVPGVLPLVKADAQIMSKTFLNWIIPVFGILNI